MTGGSFRRWPALIAAAIIVLAPACYRIQPTQKAGSDTTNRVATGGKVDGVHGSADANAVAGWAWDPSQPDTPISVDIYDGDRLIATVVADKFTDALVKEGIGNGKHVFAYFYPPSMKDGKEHTFRVRVAGSDIDLRQTPRTVTIPLATPATAATKKK
jgi:hypothetical protein